MVARKECLCALGYLYDTFIFCNGNERNGELTFYLFSILDAKEDHTKNCVVDVNCDHTQFYLCVYVF